MSDTPRTDAAAYEPTAEWGLVVKATFAEELERENAKLREEVATLRSSLDSHLRKR